MVVVVAKQRLTYLCARATLEWIHLHASASDRLDEAEDQHKYSIIRAQALQQAFDSLHACHDVLAGHLYRDPTSKWK